MINIKIDEYTNKKLIIVHVNGELNIESINDIRGTWYKQVEKRPLVIAINCTKLEKIDSSGIGNLVLFLNNAMNQNIKLVFFGLNYPIQKLFYKAKLNQFFTITTRSKFETDYSIGFSDKKKHLKNIRPGL